jgi:glucose-1-phosphate adenylyltransferase
MANVRVNSYSEVHDSILMESVDIGRHCRIRRAIIDKDVVIPPDTEIGYNLEKDKKHYHVTPSGIVVIAKGTEISNDAKTAAIVKERS